MLAIRTEQWGEYIHVAFRACLHGGGGPQTCAGSSHLSCKRDQIEIRDFMGLPHLSELRHLPGVPHLHVNRPLDRYFKQENHLLYLPLYLRVT